MKIISIASLKGGVGKSTLAINLSMALDAMHKKILAIDLDHNNNFTDGIARHLSIEEIEGANAYHFLTKKKPVEECIHKSVIDIIPGSLILHMVGAEMSNNPGGLLRIKQVLKKLNYQYIIIDSHPTTGYTTQAALFAADCILTPLTYSRWTVQAVKLLKDQLENIEHGTGTRPQLIAVPSMVTKSEREKIQQARGIIDMTDSVISRSGAIRTAQDKGVELKKDSKSYIEFKELAKEIIKRVG